jgi:hypothetical protein
MESLNPGWTAFRYVLLCTLLAGCRHAPPSQDSNLHALAAIYSQYLARHGGQYPRNEKDFKTFIGSLSSGLDAGQLDKMFISERDGKPYRIRYSEEKAWPLPNNIIAYEQEGKSDRRVVATDLGGVSELSEEEFRTRMAADTKAAPGGKR